MLYNKNGVAFELLDSLQPIVDFDFRYGREKLGGGQQRGTKYGKGGIYVGVPGARVKFRNDLYIIFLQGNISYQNRYRLLCQKLSGTTVSAI